MPTLFHSSGDSGDVTANTRYLTYPTLNVKHQSKPHHFVVSHQSYIKVVTLLDDRPCTENCGWILCVIRHRTTKVIERLWSVTNLKIEKTKCCE